MTNRKKIILSVSNDLHSDQRLQKVCNSLIQAGFQLELVGRYLKGRSGPIKRDYPFKRFHLWFNQGPLFYFNLNLRLFFHLVFNRFDLLIANDLDTLPANFLVSRLKGSQLVYDSHEYFTEVPELIERPKVKRIWERIENWILPKLKHAYTVSPSIAKAYHEKYGLQMAVVRNFPILREEEIQLESKKKAVIYQGALNVGRGLEELIHAFTNSKLDGVQLWIFGAGDIENDLLKLRDSLGLKEQVTFFGRKDSAELKGYTQKAALGVSLEHPMGLSYQFAIPNKLFDYLHAGTAVLYSPLKEVELLLDGKEVGEKLCSHEADELADQIREMLDSAQLPTWQANARALAKEYCWENEEKLLLQIVGNALDG